MCNGYTDCSDNSDETTQCAFYVCDPGYIKCSYGACVKHESDCGSTIAQTKALGSCSIEEIPRNGFVQYNDSVGSHLTINETVQNLENVLFTCIENHRIVGNDTIGCRDGNWNENFPQCEPFCPPIVSKITFFAECKLNGEVVNCTDPAKPGTTAKITCKYGYESISSEQQTTCASDGQWQSQPKACTQICGQRAEGTSDTLLPWHVTIYKLKSLDLPFEKVCGGIILNAKVILSAAHCFQGEKIGFIFSTERSFSDFGDSDEKGQAQVFDKYEQIHYGARYTGAEGRFFHNFAIVVLKGHIEFNAFTLPICVDYDLDDEEQYVTPGLKGLVGSWENLNSSALKTIEMTVISRDKCRSNSSEEFLGYLTSDKFCAETPSPDVFLTHRDGGSGLVLPIEKNGKITYYLKGILSTGSPNNTLDQHKYFTFTNIAYNLNFGQEYRSVEVMNIGAPATETATQVCTIEEIPAHGFIAQWHEPLIYIRLGFISPNYKLFRYSCETNYTLKGESTNVCLNGTWTNSIPECIPFSTGVNTGRSFLEL